VEVSGDNEAEIALINLAFAEAELVAAGISLKAVDRALEHIREAQGSLKKIVVSFDETSCDKDIEGTGSQHLRNL
jgi:hypothetical protein